MSKVKKYVFPGQGKRVKEFLKHFGLTQMDLADVLDVEQGTISKYATSTNAIPPEYLEIISDIYKVNPAFFTGQDDRMVLTEEDLLEDSAKDWYAEDDAERLLRTLGYDIHKVLGRETNREYNLLRDGKKVAEISWDDWYYMAEEITEEAKAKAERLIRRKGES